jgi:branched-chain amino acid transport system ATP-binding protein
VSATPLLELRGVEAAYGSIQILHGVSLHVDPGEVVAVIGPNGAGKSTTFKAIMGFLVHLGGEITFDGRPLVGQRPDRVLGLGLGYVPQGRVVFGQMTVLENLEMGAYTRNDRAIAEDMERIFGVFPRLKERRSQVAGTLSGGEQQMLAIGRALMARPRLLLLDEPSMGLAPVLVEQIFETVQTINRQGVTILLVEQNAAMALAIAQRGYVLETGAVALRGAASELAGNPEVRRAYLGEA